MSSTFGCLVVIGPVAAHTGGRLAGVDAIGVTLGAGGSAVRPGQGELRGAVVERRADPAARGVAAQASRRIRRPPECMPFPAIRF